MSPFLELPRELRDMIYMAVITWERLRPTLDDTYGWPNTWNLQSGHRGEDGCVFAKKGAPSTCANMLAVNRQVNAELAQAVNRARRAGLLTAKLDCVARNGETFYFTWLAVPIVSRTNPSKIRARNRSTSHWAPKVPAFHRLLTTSCREPATGEASTRIEQLRIDVRIFDNDLAKQTRLRSPPVQASWAICAALKRLCENANDHELRSTQSCPSNVIIGTLVLNIIPPVVPPTLPTDLRESAQLEAASLPQAVAREVVDVWNKLWAGDSFKARQYRLLLEKIMKVRICIDGVLVRERELKLELERGQAERRRIAMRVGW
ncbi:hypothetical protein BKA63DRAFT_429306 [Paraphoma chrysanthemicola]|nr:hypothetical protein BKA63DRAFT_429306 [Paraphoma chrysanthemicola]